MSAQRDVEKGKAKIYPIFGVKLFSIVTANLPNGVTKNKRSVVTYLNNEANLCFDTTSTYAWLNGDVLGSKPLSVDNFKRILLFYIGKNGLTTMDEINGWVATGPRRFDDVLLCEEIQKKLNASKILLPTIDRGEELAKRQKLWRHLLRLVLSAASADRFPTASGSNPYPGQNLIIIQGPPGFGKTTFLKRLQSDPAIQSRFDQVFQACCDPKMTPEAFLDFCLRKLLPEEQWHPGHPIVLTGELQRAIRGKCIILLADNISTPEEVLALKPLYDLGCLLVVATRSLEVARLADYSNVVELTAYSESDVLEYYSKNYTEQPSPDTKEKLFQLADMVCYNPLALRIALRRVEEEGWERVIKKVRLAPSIRKKDFFEDLHTPLWLAYASLDEEGQKKFRSLGALPELASYDEEHLGLFWGVSKTLANEILVRLEKEAGLARRDPNIPSHWHFHPQILNYARFKLKESPLRDRNLFLNFYLVRIALHEKRLGQFPFVLKGIKPEVLQTYWKMIQKECKRQRLPIILAELRRLVDPSYSTDWSVFTKLTSNCTLEDYVWGYRNLLESKLDIGLFFIYLFWFGVMGGLQSLGIILDISKESSMAMSILNLFLQSTAFISGFYIVIREIHRRYNWGQLWHDMTPNRNDDVVK